MSDHNYHLAAKTMLTDIFKNHFDVLDNDWVLSDDEMDAVISLRDFRIKDQPSISFDEVVDECYRIDTNSKRPMTAGFLIWGGVAYFVDEAEAVTYLNDNGFACSAFSEAYEASEAGEMDECYYTEWH